MSGLASILFLGIGAQWLAWRLGFPSILLLLVVGFVAGPLTGALDPDQLLGDALLPFVSLSVAAILLEGGLSLRLRDLRGVGGAVRNLIVIGASITFVLAALAAKLTLDVQNGTALLIGGVLVVTGPTVIVPLLRHVRPSGSVGSVVRWEGIVTDPFGAILAVLVFQVMSLHGGGGGSAAAETAEGLARAFLFGGAFGLAGAAAYVGLQRADLLPDFLESSCALTLGLGSFVAANHFQHESGLLAVTLMGILLANQRWVTIEHILDFKENLRTLLISSLFILLAARLPLEQFTAFDLRTALFVALLILVVRPLSVFLSTLGTQLSWREKVFVAWMAPRGIVAAAVASVFALELREIGHPDAHRIVPVIFAVIVITVTVYGLTAGPLARRLGLARSNPQGVLILGAHEWARELALALRALDVSVLLVDRNYHDVNRARIAGLDAYYGNILSEEFELRAPLHEMGFLLCLTPNDEVNALACLHFAPQFGRANQFQLSPERIEKRSDDSIPAHLRGRVLFGEELDFWELQARFRKGAVVKRTRLSEEFPFEAFRATYEKDEHPVVPLFLVSEDGRLSVISAGAEVDPEPGDTLVALVRPEEEPRSRGAREDASSASPDGLQAGRPALP